MGEKLRVLVVGAHPDDCELTYGGMAALYADAGHEVLMMSVTDGRTGHHAMKPSAVAVRRRKEARRAAKALGARSKVLRFHSNELFPDIATRKVFLSEVRRFSPHVILAHQLEDYHPDHRASVQLVLDISYSVLVPHASRVKAMRETPVIMHSGRGLTTAGAPERIICVPIDGVWDRKLRAIHEHESQFYEWLPWVDKTLSKIPKSRSGRLRYLEAQRKPRDEAVAAWCKKKVKGRKNKGFRCAEAAYAARAGRELTRELIEKLFPFEKLVIGF